MSSSKAPSRSGDQHPAVCLARHGLAAPRGQAALASSSGGRFGRMFAHLPSRDPGADAIEALAMRMERDAHSEQGVDQPQSLLDDPLPAGYTYLAQFVDHDITFDATSKLQRDNDPEALVNFRTPRLDLDSLYGSGPADQPYLYDWTCGPYPGVKLLVGTDPPKSDPPIAVLDLPRNAQGRALIGDARNDENLIVSQLHLLFIRFHNSVVDHLCEQAVPPPGLDLLDEAQRIVRWHYQWIVVHDLLPRIVGKALASSVLRPGVAGEPATVERRYFTWQDEPMIPVEFSGAAFRFAHSMVRHTYGLNADVPQASIFFEPGSPNPAWMHLGGFRPRPAALTISWSRFFPIDKTSMQRAMMINEKLSEPLYALPPDGASLARLNLQRGRALGLPAGADVAQAMGKEPLTDAELALRVAEPFKTELLRATPLWFYLLREAAEHGASKHLGPVGGRIVAEVLVGLLEADPSSYMRQAPAWQPSLPRANKGEFTMPDLVRFTEGIAPPKPPKPRKRKPG